MKLNEIDLSEYINEDHVQKIIADAVEDNLTRRVGVFIEEAVQRYVDDLIAENFYEEFYDKIKESLEEVVEGMNFYNIFRQAGLYDREDNPAYTLLHKAVTEDLAEEVKARASKVIAGMDGYDLGSTVGEVITDVLRVGLGDA